MREGWRLSSRQRRARACAGSSLFAAYESERESCSSSSRRASFCNNQCDNPTLTDSRGSARATRAHASGGGFLLGGLPQPSDGLLVARGRLGGLGRRSRRRCRRNHLRLERAVLCTGCEQAGGDHTQSQSRATGAGGATSLDGMCGARNRVGVVSCTRSAPATRASTGGRTDCHRGRELISAGSTHRRVPSRWTIWCRVSRPAAWSGAGCSRPASTHSIYSARPRVPS